MPSPVEWRDRAGSGVFVLIACLLFAGSIAQPPLFDANQNTYFLAGLAREGYGYLASDWLARQTDAVPVFSALVSLMYQVGDFRLFSLLVLALNGALAAVYAAALFALTGIPVRRSWAGAVPVVVFFVLLTLLHSPGLLDLPFVDGSAGAAWTVGKLTGVARALTNGVAHQSGMSNVLQPSAFGILMIASIALFVHRKDYAAVVCACVAANIHTSLILHAGILTAAYLIVCATEGRFRRAAGVGVVALLMTIPITLYVAHHFVLLDSPEVHRLGHRISADLRHPHHTMISVWFSAQTGLQLAVVAAATLLARGRRRLFLVMSLCAGAALCLTLTQLITGSRSLALLFPWRASTWLVPISTMLVAARLASIAIGFSDRIRRDGAARILVCAAAVLLIAASFDGVRGNVVRSLADHQAGTIEAWVRSNRAPGQAYLVPLDFEHFRLQAGVPIFVDWKSSPYRSGEIIVWYQRAALAAEFYGAGTAAEAAVALARIQQLQTVTHVVLVRDASAAARPVTYLALPPFTGSPRPPDALALCTALAGRPVFHDRVYLLCDLRP